MHIVHEFQSQTHSYSRKVQCNDLTYNSRFLPGEPSSLRSALQGVIARLSSRGLRRIHAFMTTRMTRLRLWKPFLDGLHDYFHLDGRRWHVCGIFASQDRAIASLWIIQEAKWHKSLWTPRKEAGKMNIWHFGGIGSKVWQTAIHPCRSDGHCDHRGNLEHLFRCGKTLSCDSS